MPKRIVDGESLWNSDKLRTMDVPNCLPKLIYAWLLPLAESNGVFEYDESVIWSKTMFVQDIASLDELKTCLDLYRNNGLLLVWSQKGKRWGYWVGIEKAGRLPPHSQRAKYTTDLPDVPAELLEDYKNEYLSRLCDEPRDRLGKAYPEPRENLDRLGLGLGLGRGIGAGAPTLPKIENETETDMKIQDEIVSASLKILGTKPYIGDRDIHDLKIYVKTFGRREVVAAFETWAEQHRGEEIRWPVSEFLKVAPGLLQGIIDPARTAEATDLAVALHQTEPRVSAAAGKELAALGALLRDGFSAQEIKSAYAEHVQVADDWSVARALRTFCDGAGRVLMLSKRKDKQSQLELEAAMTREQNELRERVDRELDARSTEEAIRKADEDREVEEAAKIFPGFGN